MPTFDLVTPDDEVVLSCTALDDDKARAALWFQWKAKYFDEPREQQPCHFHRCTIRLVGCSR